MTGARSSPSSSLNANRCFICFYLEIRYFLWSWLSLCIWMAIFQNTLFPLKCYFESGWSSKWNCPIPGLISGSVLFPVRLRFKCFSQHLLGDALLVAHIVPRFSSPAEFFITSYFTDASWHLCFKTGHFCHRMSLFPRRKSIYVSTEKHKNV